MLCCSHALFVLGGSQCSYAFARSSQLTIHLYSSPHVNTSSIDTWYIEYVHYLLAHSIASQGLIWFLLDGAYWLNLHFSIMRVTNYLIEEELICIR